MNPEAGTVTRTGDAQTGDVVGQDLRGGKTTTMTNIIEHANTDVRLDGVHVDDQDTTLLMESESTPVLATPMAAVGLFTAGLAVEEAADD